MITLGVDTSGKTLSVAVLKGDVPVAELLLSTGYRHGVTLQPAIEYILGQADLNVKDVDLFAVTTGPGSFTGIRIGLSSVKAMAYAAGAKAVGVSSLHALARSTVNDDRPVFAMFDARGGRVFGGLFRGDEHVLGGEPQTIAQWIESIRHKIAPVNDDRPVFAMFDARGGRVFGGLFRGDEHVLGGEPQTIAQWIESIRHKIAPGEVVTLTGDGVDVFRQAAESDDLALLFDIAFAPVHQRVIRASVVANIAMERLKAGEAETDPFLLDAHYGLLSSAERAGLGQKT